MSTHLFLLVCLLIGSSAAVDITDFSNDLASDLGPLLSLFGDSMTKQFLSESVTHLDYIIFAVAPIGIITALVSTVRLCGSTAFRAFIGRSQEGQGAVEAELCTSTSRDVCELFTRGGIQRVLGRPSILELVYLPGPGVSEKSSEILSRDRPKLLLSRDYFMNHARTANSSWKELKSVANRSPILAPNPNLSLNIGIRRPSNWILWVIAIVGTMLQVGVLALAGVGVWILGWDLSKGGGPAARDYAPIMFIVGTSLMCIGMWGCAYLIGQTTQEIRFQRKSIANGDVKPRLLWLQPGPQVIGDQSFDPFAYLENENTVDIWSSSRKRLDKKFKLYTYLAVLATLIGYIMQFIGIRGMEAWVSLAQLAVTILMSILRGSLRTQRLGNNDNQLRSIPDMVAGYELDWLAYRLASKYPLASPCWHVTANYKEELGSERRPEHVPRKGRTTENIQKSPISVGTALKTVAVASTGPDADSSTPSLAQTDDGDLLDIRTRLANLTGLFSSADGDSGRYQKWDDEHIKVRVKARQLSSIFATVLLSRPIAEAFDGINLPIYATTLGGQKVAAQPIGLTLKAPPEFSLVGWQFDAAQLEAILGLWMWTMISNELVVQLDRDLQASEVGADQVPKTSRAEQVPTARIVSFSVDDANWQTNIDIQSEMDLWLGNNAVRFRQATVAILGQQPYGLATLFSGNKEDDQKWSAIDSKDNYTTESMHRFCGWTLAHQAISDRLKQHTPSDSATQKVREAANSPVAFRLQYVQLSSPNVSLLNTSCQELFVALMMSLIEFKAEVLERATFVERGNTIRLEHPVISMFAASFVDAGLGTYSDALLCVVPALRQKMPPLNLETMLPALDETAKAYRQELQWKRAETVLLFGCTRSNQQDTPRLLLAHALRSLCELYRWALSRFSDNERTFGLSGIETLNDKFGDVHRSDPMAEEVLKCYSEIARKFKEGIADQERVAGSLSNKRKPKWALRLLEPNHLKTLQDHLLKALQKVNRTEALYQLCLLTPECEYGPAIPTSALALAVRNNWAEIASALLELNANPNDADEDGKRAILHCAELGYEDCAKLLLDRHASLDTIVSQKGLRLTPFHAAMRNGHTGIVKLLLDNGLVERDQVDDQGLTPLMTAVLTGRTEIVKVLINTPGVSLNRKELERSPLSCASASGHIEIMELLLNTDKVDVEHMNRMNQTPLWLAVSNHHEAAAMLLLERGANIEVKDKEGMTALAHAVQNMDIALVRRLLENGAMVDVQNNSLETPLMTAIIRLGNCEVSELDEVLQATQGGEEILPKQAQICKEIVQILLQYHADIGIRNANGHSVLTQAATSKNNIGLGVLLAHGADTNTTDTWNCTPLMHAAKAGRKKGLEMLLKAGANIECKDLNGRTALFYAMEDRESLEMLINYGADKEVKDNDGYTVLKRLQELNSTTLVDLQKMAATGNLTGKEKYERQKGLEKIDALIRVLDPSVDDKAESRLGDVLPSGER
jgi:ankyrin repeat protein